MTELKWVLREVLFDDGQPIAHRKPQQNRRAALDEVHQSLHEEYHMTMTTQTPLDRVLILIVKAAEAEKADDAMKFSQAACNAANALCALASTKQNLLGESK